MQHPMFRVNPPPASRFCVIVMRRLLRSASARHGGARKVGSVPTVRGRIPAPKQMDPTAIRLMHRQRNPLHRRVIEPAGPQAICDTKPVPGGFRRQFGSTEGGRTDLEDPLRDFVSFPMLLRSGIGMDANDRTARVLVGRRGAARRFTCVAYSQQRVVKMRCTQTIGNGSASHLRDCSGIRLGVGSSRCGRAVGAHLEAGDPASDGIPPSVSP